MRKKPTRTDYAWIFNATKSKGNKKSIFTSLVIVVLLALVIDYVTLPAYNLQNSGIYMLFAFYFIAFGVLNFLFSQRFSTLVRNSVAIGALLVVFVVVMSLLGSELINSRKYRDQIVITEKTDFSSNFSAIALNRIPVVDKATAIQLGDKQIGKVQGLGSQYNIDPTYTLVSTPTNILRVSPLEYQDIIKWFNNRDTGIPDYIRVNVNDASDVSMVALAKGMKYVPSAFFDQDLLRHVRFKYRTAILQDFSFEVDDSGKPYYVLSVVQPKIGLFGGKDAIGVIVVDPVDGSMNKYDLASVPAWVDRVQPTELAWAQIDNWGYYVHGFWNTIFGQKDMIQTTAGYNYVSINGSTYVFSGMTSVGADKSIVGFSLINLHTKKADFYRIGGADEASAMSSAQGQVQHLGYVATFPVLLNVEKQPTYFISLKDQEGLVKMYAFVAVTDYSLVGVGDTVAAAQVAYINKLNEKGVIEGSTQLKTVEAKITAIDVAIVGGNSNYYLRLEGVNKLLIAPIGISSELAISKVGDTVKVTYLDSSINSIVINTYDNLNYNY
ncbi:MAG: CvpA family protein [Erysipelotrichaceae bacterium]